MAPRPRCPVVGTEGSRSHPAPHAAGGPGRRAPPPARGAAAGREAAALRGDPGAVTCGSNSASGLCAQGQKAMESGSSDGRVEI